MLQPLFQAHILDREDFLAPFLPAPFVPDDSQDRQKRCEGIFAIPYMGLKKRLEDTRTRTAVVGISGGLDATLAMRGAVREVERL